MCDENDLWQQNKINLKINYREASKRTIEFAIVSEHRICAYMQYMDLNRDENERYEFLRLRSHFSLYF